MFRNTVFSSILAGAALMAFSPSANAQWVRNLKEARKRPVPVYYESLGPVAAQAAVKEKTQPLGQVELLTQPLVGTWRLTIPDSADGPGFLAFQSYHVGGTLTEVSSLLPSLTESPAQGVWAEDNGQYITTFELFAFEDGKPVGIIRVRTVTRLVNADELKAESTVDFIDLDGKVTEGIAHGPFTGKRVQLLKP